MLNGSRRWSKRKNAFMTESRLSETESLSSQRKGKRKERKEKLSNYIENKNTVITTEKQLLIFSFFFG